MQNPLIIQLRNVADTETSKILPITDIFSARNLLRVANQYIQETHRNYPGWGKKVKDPPHLQIDRPAIRNPPAAQIQPAAGLMDGTEESNAASQDDAAGTQRAGSGLPLHPRL